MGRLLIVVASGALAACSHPKTSGPKWPEPSTTAEDGGESIEPRPSSSYAAVVEKSNDDDDNKPAETTTSTSTATPATEDKPATTSTPSMPSSDDVFQTEEIIIEIDD